MHGCLWEGMLLPVSRSAVDVRRGHQHSMLWWDPVAHVPMRLHKGRGGLVMGHVLLGWRASHHRVAARRRHAHVHVHALGAHGADVILGPPPRRAATGRAGAGTGVAGGGPAVRGGSRLNQTALDRHGAALLLPSFGLQATAAAHGDEGADDDEGYEHAGNNEERQVRRHWKRRGKKGADLIQVC